MKAATGFNFFVTCNFRFRFKKVVLYCMLKLFKHGLNMDCTLCQLQFSSQKVSVIIPKETTLLTGEYIKSQLTELGKRQNRTKKIYVCKILPSFYAMFISTNWIL